jgi:periplasmic divalent cation tolerance protein
MSAIRKIHTPPNSPSKPKPASPPLPPPQSRRRNAAAGNAAAGSTAAFIGWTTFPNREAAEAFARLAVERKLAACAQVAGNPINSFYRWKGTVCADAEWRVTLKFPASTSDALAALLREQHTYEVPQWVALEITAGTREYLDWLRSCGE